MGREGAGGGIAWAVSLGSRCALRITLNSSPPAARRRRRYGPGRMLPTAPVAGGPRSRSVQL